MSDTQVIEKLCKTKEEILDEIKRQEILSKEVDDQNYNKDQYNNGHDRALRRLRNLLYFVESGVKWEHDGRGMIRLEHPEGGYMVYSLYSGKWKHDKERSKHFPYYKKKWRVGIQPQNFLKRYIYGEEF